MLERYGLIKYFASQRPFGIDANDLYPDKMSSSDVIESVLSAAKTCVYEDGAEIVIPGCTLAGSILTHEVFDVESKIGVPVLDGMVTGFKMAEMMPDMKASGIPTIGRKG
jgi:Asp/Glu/hydantoin racemase